MDLEYALQLVKMNGNRIQMVEDPTPEIREAAIRRTPTAISYIPDATVDEQKIAIEVQGRMDREGIFELVEMIANLDRNLLDDTIDYNGNCIKLIDAPTADQLERAVTRDGDAIKHIDNPDEVLQALAVEADPKNLKYISDPDYFVAMNALKENPRTIEFIAKPHKDHQEYVLKELPDDGLHYIQEVDEEIALNHIKEHPEQIELLNNQFEEACWLALNASGEYIKLIRNPSPEMVGYARLVSDGSY